jgi:hypothetical protein
VALGHRPGRSKRLRFLKARPKDHRRKSWRGRHLIEVTVERPSGRRGQVVARRHPAASLEHARSAGTINCPLEVIVHLLVSFRRL